MKISFIINPISGTARKTNIPDIVRKYLNINDLQPSFFFTERQGHAFELAQQHAAEGVPFVVAVGGDGTVNEVASALRGTDSALGIIPSGSGNGLARHLHLPLHIEPALKVISRKNVCSIDYGTVNGHPFFCTLGTGFDAHVSEEFSHSSRRGFRKYVAIIAREFIAYKAHQYRLVIDGTSFNVRAMLVTIANASQYGNNGFIAPLANITDGKLEVCIIKPFFKIAAPTLAVRLLTRTIHKSPLYQGFSAKNVIIEREHADMVHLDGDPVKMDKTLTINIVPLGLNVMVP